MADAIRPLSHDDSSMRDDDDATRAREAREHFSRWPAVQLVGEMYAKLRAQRFSWWSNAKLRERWPARTRMGWLAERPDLRQTITTSLTGLPKNAARQKSHDFQADLIDSVLTHGDVDEDAFENAFHAMDLATYAPAQEIWSELMTRFPWHTDAVDHQRFIGWMIRAFVTDRCSLHAEISRKPILTACDVRQSIDARVWQTYVPLDVRVAVDAARMKHERTRPREAFQARHEMSIATPEVLAAHVPLCELMPIFVAAENAMGFGGYVQMFEPMASSDLLAPQSAPPAPQSIVALRQTGT